MTSLPCKKCEVIKPETEYNRGNRVCKVCRSKMVLERYHATKTCSPRRISDVIAGKRRCTSCGMFKDLTIENFSRNTNGAAPFMKTCRACIGVPLSRKVKVDRTWGGR